jgi:hypothetical protein
MKIIVNLNDKVSVRLTPAGEAIWADWYRAGNPLRSIPDYITKKIDEKGWISFQLWDFMNVFGPALYLGMHAPLFVENDVRFE